LEDISVRLWPGATPVQALLTAFLGSGRPVPPAAELAAEQIRVPPATYEAHRLLAHPAGCFEALLSFHYVAAMSILEGRFDIDLADHGHGVDPDTLLFIDEHVALMADPGVPRGGVQVTLTTHGDATTLHTTGRTHERESRGYRPSASLRHLIEIRNPACTGPGCHRPATRRDLAPSTSRPCATPSPAVRMCCRQDRRSLLL
jgi:hypothetical protein